MNTSEHRIIDASTAVTPVRLSRSTRIDPTLMQTLDADGFDPSQLLTLVVDCVPEYRSAVERLIASVGGAILGVVELGGIASVATSMRGEAVDKLLNKDVIYSIRLEQRFRVRATRVPTPR